MTKSTTNGQSSRFGDSPLAFGIERFANYKDRAIWVFSITKFCGGDVLYEENADLKALRSMRTWLDKAISVVESDGGRKTLEISE